MAQSTVTFRPGAHRETDSGIGTRRPHPRHPQPDQGPGRSSEPRALPWIATPPISPAASEAVRSASGSGVDIRVYGDLSVFEAAGKNLEQHGARAVLQWFAWLAAWQRDVGAPRGTVPAVVTGCDGDGQVLFILPLAVETEGLVRRLTWLGSPACNYNAPLLSARFFGRMSAPRFLQAWKDVIGLLRADPRSRFDLVDLQKMPKAVGAQRNPFLDLPALTHASDAGGDDEELYDCLAGVTAKGWLLAGVTAAYRRTRRVVERSPRLRRALRQAQRLAGLLEVELRTISRR
jgi:CelD/BcsL family acetyltransferase involved in cellulose biosynthesis